MPCKCSCHGNDLPIPCSNCKVLHDQKKTFDYGTTVRDRLIFMTKRIKDRLMSIYQEFMQTTRNLSKAQVLRAKNKPSSGQTSVPSDRELRELQEKLSYANTNKIKECFIALVQVEALISELAQHNIRYDFLQDHSGSCNPDKEKHAQPTLLLHRHINPILNMIFILCALPKSYEDLLIKEFVNSVLRGFL